MDETILKFLGEDELLLNASTNFVQVDWNIHEEELNGNYLLLDGKRSEFVMTDVASYGYTKVGRNLLLIFVTRV